MEIMIGKDGNQLGPFTHDQVRSMLHSGMLASTDMFWHEGRPGWSPLKELFPSMSTSAPALQPAASSARKIVCAGYICAGVSLLIFPMGLGIAGLTLGILALTRQAIGHGIAIIVLSVTLAILGTYIGMILLS